MTSTTPVTVGKRPAAPPELSAHGLSLAYDGRAVVHEVDLRVPTGRVTVVVGANGCGKSTLLRGLGRLLPPTAGEVRLGGGDIARMPTREVAEVLGLPPEDRRPRRNSIEHVKKQIEDIPASKGPTVGHGVIASIEAIRTVCGESGARDIDTVFTDPDMTEHYRKPLSDRSAHRVVATKEVEYWSAQDKTKSTSGSKAALKFDVEERGTLDVRVLRPDGSTGVGWALNEAALEKVERSRMLEVLLEVDGHPLSSFGCDGVVAATATGSTAHAFSAGGPVVSPRAEALVFTPIAPHMAFGRSVVTAPDEPVGLRVLERSGQAAVSVDGQLRGVLDPGDWIGVYAARRRLRAVRLKPMDFYGRLRERMSLTDAPAAVADGTPAPLWSVTTPPPDDLAHLTPLTAPREPSGPRGDAG